MGEWEEVPQNNIYGDNVARDKNVYHIYTMSKDYKDMVADLDELKSDREDLQESIVLYPDKDRYKEKLFKVDEEVKKVLEELE